MVSRPSRFVLGFAVISLALLAVPLVMFAMLAVTEREYEHLVAREGIAEASDRLQIAVLEVVAEARRQASTPDADPATYDVPRAGVDSNMAALTTHGLARPEVRPQVDEIGRLARSVMAITDAAMEAAVAGNRAAAAGLLDRSVAGPLTSFRTASSELRAEALAEIAWSRERLDNLRRAELVLIAVGSAAGAVSMLVLVRIVTVGRRAEASMRAAEERLERAMSAGRMGTWDWDVRSGRVTWSDSMHAVYGLAPGSFGGTLEEFRSHIYPADRESADAAIARAVETKSNLDFEHRIVRPDGAARWLNGRGQVVLGASGEVVGMRGVGADVTERKEAEELLSARQRQQAAVAELGRHALDGTKLPELLDEAARLAAETLGVDYAKVMELQPDDTLLLRAGVGWRPGLVGRCTVDAGHAQAGAALQAPAPVVVEDLLAERRAEWTLLSEHQVRSGISVVISGGASHPGQPYGVLGVHARTVRRFTADDVNFIQAVANVLATAVDRVRAEEALRASQQELTDFVERVTEGLHWVDAEGRIAWANQAQLALLGYMEREYVGRHVSELCADQETRRLVLDALAARREVQAEQARLLANDGSERHVLLSTNVPRSGGDGVYMRFLVTDITARKRAEQAIRAREHQQAAVATLGLTASSGQDADALMQEAATRIAETLEVDCVLVMELQPDGSSFIARAGAGWGPEIIGRATIEGGAGSQAGYTLQAGQPVIVEDHRAETRFAMPAFATERGFISGLSVVIPGGERPYGVLGAQTKSRRAFTADDVNFVQAVANVIGVAVERRRTEERQRFLAEATTVLSSSLDHEQTLRSIARMAVPYVSDWCAIHLVEDDGTIRILEVAHVDPQKAEWARRLRERSPMGPNAAYGASNVVRTGQSELYRTISDEALAAIVRDEEQLQLMREVGIRSAMIVPLKARDRVMGAIMFVSAESGRRFAPTDLAFAEELASRAATAMDNARLYQQAQEAARVREEFLAIASHELRSPLTSILGFSGRLARRAAREDGRFDESSREEMELLHSEAQRMRRTIELFLDLARLESGQVEVAVDTIDLRALLQEEVAALRQRTGDALIEERYPDRPVLIDSDGDLVRQILTNLLDNAVKYGGKPPAITVTLIVDGAGASVGVRDNGEGIPETDRPHIFERFYRQQNSTSRRPAGLGLGLYISKAIAERLGASLSFETEQGNGTEFLLRLPAGPTE